MAEQRPPGAGWHLYLLRCADGTLYTGISTDVERRIREHAAGGSRGARRLRSRGPLELVYGVELGSRSVALRTEHRVKSLSRSDKESLVAARPDAGTLLRQLGLGADD